jgi:hypothetical protein
MDAKHAFNYFSDKVFTEESRQLIDKPTYCPKVADEPGMAVMLLETTNGILINKIASSTTYALDLRHCRYMLGDSKRVTVS